jgi:hypothetical protein
LFVDAGMIVLTAFISPFRSEREMARGLLQEGEFIEIFVDTPLAVAEEPNPKDLYKKARRGELKNFTGIDSPYDPGSTNQERLTMTISSIDEQNLLNGQTWSTFCDHLKRCGEQILRPEAPADAATRAEGFRYLTRLLRIGLEMHIEFADPAFPSFFKTSHETAKIGADNPDNLYEYSRLDGTLEYRIKGHRGSVAYLSFGTQKGGYETDVTLTQTGFIDASQLQVDAQGNFEIILSREPKPGNWLKMEDATNALIVRQTFLDRRIEEPAKLSIERMGTDSKPQALDPATFQQGLARVSSFVENTARLFADWSQSYLPHSNRLPPANQALCQSVGGDPNIFYYHSHWALAPSTRITTSRCRASGAPSRPVTSGCWK